MELLGTIVSVGTLVVSGVLAYIAKSAQADINKLRVEIAEGRLQDLQARTKERDEFRHWVNGSFLRATLVEARFTEFDYRLSQLEGATHGQN